MHITKCDICKKETDGKYVSADVGFFPKIEACYDCGLPTTYCKVFKKA